MLNFWRSQGVDAALIEGVEAYRARYPWTGERAVVAPRYHFYGRRTIEQAAAALLAGENLLLSGVKATGKNVLAENLAAAFGRPDWNVSLHINMDASFLIGSDSFADGRVIFRPGPVYECARAGGFGILDEINMARNEALAVLHSLLDFRRVMDVPGYDRLALHPAARFIATMNHGYAGTRELNEALASRFVVLQLEPIGAEDLERLLAQEFPALRSGARQTFISLFRDLQQKCESGEISTQAVDLRGLLAALALVRAGLSARTALAMGIANKVFDRDERALVDDLLDLSLPEDLAPARVFED
ncbi:MAG: MoxR family ATPase [Schwartzia sp.]|nr:MoxR family ATPase [Schwartzia sp. (in: firmicutes)]